MLNKLFIAFQYLVPQILLTRLAGRLARSEAALIKGPFIRLFIRRFKVDMDEALDSDPASYASFNAFFTRALKPGLRPVAPGDSEIASPADGAISQIGQIHDGEVFQAKGKSFDLCALIGDEELSRCYRDGSFATIYLSPRDYHRLHMPVDGTLLSSCYIPGKLFSVNEVTANTIDGLFALNERLVMHFETPQGPMAAVMVGAMIVGAMETVWDQNVADGRAAVLRKDWRQENIRLKKGEELGRFLLGSTIILCFPRGQMSWRAAHAAGAHVRLGQALGDYNPGG